MGKTKGVLHHAGVAAHRRKQSFYEGVELGPTCLNAAGFAMLSEGVDILVGGTGNDSYAIDDAGDVVTELVNEGSDTVRSHLISTTLAANVENLMLLGRHNASGTGNDLNNILTGNSANNLNVRVIGTDDKFTFTGWHLGDQHHVEQFQTSDGQMRQDSQMDPMVSAMAAYAPPPMGQMTLPDNYATSLAPVLASWH